MGIGEAGAGDYRMRLRVGSLMANASGPVREAIRIHNRHAGGLESDGRKCNDPAFAGSLPGSRADATD